MSNVKQAVPFFNVTDMAAALRFYVDGLGFQMTNSWQPDGTIRWCMLELDEVRVMLQTYLSGNRPEGPLGQGLTISFQCEDALALYRAFTARGVTVGRPFVGNAMWVFSVSDPDGYRLEFESATDVAEETAYDPAIH